MKRKTIFISSLTILIISIILLAIYLIYPFLRPEPNLDDVSNSTDISQDAVIIEKADNPIDFTELKTQNDDVIGWINIPGTVIDYPVLQANESLPEDFYINHNIKRDYEFAGCIYSQRVNSIDFSDPNTLLHGHNMKNGTMFAALHKFRDKTFFNENKYFYIYTPGHILKYEIFSAYRTSNKHILYYYDMNDKAVFAEYLKSAQNPTDSIRNTRPETKVTADDKIVTLCTCITNDNYRYFVQGVLVDDIQTK